MEPVSGKNFDAVIIGGGAGGLSCALALAKAGLSVILFEKNAVCGGNCSSVTIDGYKFDLALHQLIGADGQSGYCSNLLDYYGVKENIRFHKIDSFARVVSPEEEFEIPVCLDKFEQMLKERFPDKQNNIEWFINDLCVLKRDLMIGGNFLYKQDTIARRTERLITIREKWSFLLRGIRCLDDMSKTAEELLNRYFEDKKLQAFVAACWPYLGLPPSRVSGLLLFSLISSIGIEQTYYPYGSSQVIADEMVKVIEKLGAKIMINSPVNRILVENGKAVGVELSKGGKFFTPAVVSNVDALHTFTQFLDESVLPKKYLRRIKKTEVSFGPFRLFLGLDYLIQDNGFKNHEYFFFDSLDNDQCFSRLQQGYPSVICAYSPSYIDCSLAPAGHSTLVIMSFFPWETKRDWRIKKEEIADEMIAVVERKVKDLSKHIRVKRIFTPDDLHAFSLVNKGAIYGWANSTTQTLINRIGQSTPIKNLFLAGHWTKPGSGISSALISGWMASRKILRHVKNNKR